MVKKEKKIEKSLKRPPVVVVLGHVDHGKSSLLEAIKDFKITSKESGGITQHIGAYEVIMEGNPPSPKATAGQRKITFIDTPGHEAFSAMRARGTEVADIALLVVDSAQSVQPQTKEAVMAIKRAEIPMIVVLNKIDLPNANPEKIKRELVRIDIVVESMGGTIPSVEVSAKEKTGINELLEMILLVADLHDLKSEIEVPVEGLVIESYMDSFKGPVVTAIIKKGILRPKDIIATDLALAKVKSVKDFMGREIESAYPAQPAIILGFEKVPAVGEKFKSYKTVEEAMQKIKKEEPKREIGSAVIDSDPDKKVLNIILKGDVFGSLEAVEAMLKNLPQEKVILRILKSEVGEINESDAKLAEMSKAEIIGFRTKISPTVMKFMKNPTAGAGHRLRIKTFDVIYELIQNVRSGLEKSLEPEIVREDVGKLKTLLVFWGEKNRQIVGGKITEGELKKGLKLEIFRDDKKIGTGRIINLQRDKKDTDKLSKGQEAGILFEGNVKIEKGDILVAYTEERKKGEL
ncbi:MAG: translation initiation factor IF-2 [Candidatus Staskawiczbacteria bacterium RIFCSPLOWO2_01_FULL_37_25b]|uniref:Translation initiation factor IF-2 n=1 Tax=Candidatus Staskawiczbacteria bacterium RIFCSPLOWO2_01_FULL_37_25b TaxID=1802213 RepID=A0A1G2IAG5_9BACT|nr:MAG: translation initiation factor IF-2 [Candidatus Staskawiczbacteria bacterium RIFCSPLOWO2_01_FULL_37_25b]